MHLPTDRIFIVGGGPSAKGLDFSPLKEHGYVLGVNDAGILADCHGVYSMDRLWFENRAQICREMGLDVFLRGTVYDKAVPALFPGWANLYRIESYFNKKELSLEKMIVHGDNSGFQAFNFACLWEPKEIYLFGFDFQGKPGSEYWYQKYIWNKKVGYKRPDWAKNMDAAYEVIKDKIVVRLCSKSSLIKHIPKITYEEVLKACVK